MTNLTTVKIIDLLRASDGAFLQIGAAAMNNYNVLWNEFCEFAQCASFDQVSQTDVSEFLDVLGEKRDESIARKPGRPRVGRLSYQTRAAQFLARVFRGAMRLGLCRSNPAEALAERNSIAFRDDRPPPLVLESEEVRRTEPSAEDAVHRIASAARLVKTRSEWKQQRNTVLIQLVLDTSAKSGEVARMAVTDVWDHQGVVHVKIGEGERMRRLVVSEGRVADDLRAWLATHQTMRLPQRVLFPANQTSSGDDARLSPQQVYNICRAVLDQAGMKYKPGERPAGPGVLRNTALAYAYARGGSIEDVHHRSGHRHLKSTELLLSTKQVVLF